LSASSGAVPPPFPAATDGGKGQTVSSPREHAFDDVKRPDLHASAQQPARLVARLLLGRARPRSARSASIYSTRSTMLK
jgi:hypothetical protein